MHVCIRIRPTSYLMFINLPYRHRSKPDIEAFIEQANLHHPTIKFTAEISDTESVFLDMVVQPRSQGSLLPVGERTWEQG